ncbi:MAG: prenyltransferase/squalene oxidase repeat-containing protein [Deltaproteobacteria bacterium]|nr:prenyltransferase/squalene oxidase repeat-containing protein [Deltaproteobacteria bacterium]
MTASQITDVAALGSSPSEMADTQPSPEGIQGAIDRAHASLRAMQGRDGRWEGLNIAGSFGTATTLVFERYLGALDPRDAREGERYLRSKQRSDGSVGGWEFAREGSLDGTATWYAGMLAAGVAERDPDMVRAKRCIESLGGMHKTNFLTKIALVVSGALDADALPNIPIEALMLPGTDDLLAKFFGVNTLMPLHTAIPLMWALRRGSRPPSPLRNPIAYAAAQRAIDYLTTRQDKSGSWIGVTVITQMAAAALAGLGVSREDGRIRRALQHLASVKSYGREDQVGLYVAPFESALWDTAQIVRVLVATGMPANDPAISKAVGFLIDWQTKTPSPWDWQTPPAWAPKDGGWPFEVGNESNPDMDSTQQVLSALVTVSNALPAPSEALTRSIARAKEWLLAMQNPDGGWAAFAYGKIAPLPGLMYFTGPDTLATVGRMHRWVRALFNGYQTMAQLGDPSTADVAGRTLYTLGLMGMGAQDARVRNAISLIEYLHEPVTGAWWGMWAINYLPATGYILTGLASVGADLSVPQVQRALRFVLEHQNDDGGWGETPESYSDPSLAGRGASMRSITGLQVWTLSLAGDLRDATVRRALERGVSYLLAHQHSTGLWSDEMNQGVMMPNIAYYYNSTFSTYLALEALAAYREHAMRSKSES